MNRPFTLTSKAVRGNSWTASTHTVRLFGGRGLFGNTAQIPYVANGVVIYLDDSSENTSIDITAAQGIGLDRLPPDVSGVGSLIEQAALAASANEAWALLAGVAVIGLLLIPFARSDAESAKH